MAIDLSKLTPQQLEKFLHIQSIVAGQKEAQARVRALRAYYDGDMPVYLTDRQMEFVGKLLSEGEFEFVHNTIKSVVDTLRERLSVSGFTVDGAGTEDDAPEVANSPAAKLAAQFWAWWEENRLDAQQIRQHRRAIRDGTAYVMVDYDTENQRPRFTLHQADDGTTGITCHRDPENPDVIMFLVKHWYTYDPLKPGETGTQRKNIYLPSEIRKYIMGKIQWEPMDGVHAPFDPGDTRWPIPWVDSDGKPLGITLKEFENPGGSEVAQIIGLQDGLNKSWLDLVAAADMAGFPLLIVENELNAAFPPDHATDDDDIDGDDEFIIAPGRAITVDGAHVHRIEGADLSQLINVIWTFIEAIAAVSRTPQSYLRPAGGSDVPSGEALKQLESGLTARAKERQLIFGQAWSDVMLMAYKVERAFGSTSLPEFPKMKIQTIWDNPETRDDLAEAQTAQIHKALGVNDDFIFAMLGYSPSDVQKMKNTQRSDQAASTAAVVSAVQKAQASAQTPQQTTRPQPFATPAVNGNGTGRQNGVGG